MDVTAEPVDGRIEVAEPTAPSLDSKAQDDTVALRPTDELALQLAKNSTTDLDEFDELKILLKAKADEERQDLVKLKPPQRNFTKFMQSPEGAVYAHAQKQKAAADMAAVQSRVPAGWL
eukprot:2725447-Amphidinium_carterae.1